MKINDRVLTFAKVAFMVILVVFALVFLIKCGDDSSGSTRERLPRKKLHVDLSSEEPEEVAITVETEPEIEKEPPEPVNISIRFRDITQLVVEEFHFTSAGVFEDQIQLWGVDIPFGSKSFILQYSGYVSAGIDNFDDIDYCYDHDNSQLQITIPQVNIITVYIDPNSAEILDESSGIFNPIEAEDVTSFLANQQDSAEELAIRNGILESAQTRAENVLTEYARAILAGTPLEDYEIIFVEEIIAQQ